MTSKHILIFHSITTSNWKNQKCTVTLLWCYRPVFRTSCVPVCSSFHKAVNFKRSSLSSKHPVPAGIKSVLFIVILTWWMKYLWLFNMIFKHFGYLLNHSQLAPFCAICSNPFYLVSANIQIQSTIMRRYARMVQAFSFSLWWKSMIRSSADAAMMITTSTHPRFLKRISIVHLRYY